MEQTGRWPSVTAYEIDVDRCPRPPARYFVYADSQSQVSSPAEPLGAPMWMRERTFNLREYCDSAAIIASGWSFSRADVINYFLNLVEGQSVDSMSENQPGPADRLAQMSQVEGRVSVLGTEGLRSELRAIGRRLVESKDVQQLMDQLRA